MPMLEQKHRVRQLIAMKTRGQFTALPCEGEPQVLAKAGIKPPVRNKALHNRYMVRLYFGHRPGQRITLRHLISMREQWLTESDLVEIRREQRLNLEFDFKRRPVNPRMIRVGNREHVAFDTVPWDTQEEGEYARAIFDGWREHNCLKTVEDFQAWEAYYAVRIRTRGADINVTKTGAAGVMLRIFLRAYANGLWGTHKLLTYKHSLPSD